jgi:uncharacterized RDD family membrane protein YckC
LPEWLPGLPERLLRRLLLSLRRMLLSLLLLLLSLFLLLPLLLLGLPLRWALAVPVENSWLLIR